MDQGETRQERWHGHPFVARIIRLAIFVVPFLTAMAVAFVLSMRLPVATTLPVTVLRWLGIVVVSTLAMTGVDRLARRFLPLSVLLRLTLVFPDQAPSRFAIAMRTGTTAQLRKRLEAAREVPVGETPQQAAERLLELVGLLSHHDRLTRGHSERVRAYSHLIGEEMGLTESELDKLRWAGLLHDVGKTAISTDILNKPGRLTDDEFETVKTHPDEGRALVAPLADWLGDSVRAVWEHHERFDGRGYPQGLSGTDISFAARVVTVADSYDVMTSARSYKKPMSAEAARTELANCSGTQFDPIVVRSFLNISLGRLRLMTGPLAWFAQLALLEPSGVVHAGSTAIPTASSGTAGGAAATGSGATGSAGGGASGAAAATGSSVSSTLAATAASVVVSTAGIVAASPPPAQPDEPTVAAESAPAGADTGALPAPSDTVLVLENDGGRFTSADDPLLSQDAALVLDEEAPEPSTSTTTTTVEAATTTVRPSTTATTSPSTTAPSTTATTTPSTTATTRPPTTVAATTTTQPSTTVATRPTTTTTTTVPAAPAATTTTTTTTTSTTTTTTVPAEPSGERLYLGGDSTEPTTARRSRPLLSSAPPDIALLNLDTDRDAFPGVVIAKDSAGTASTDSTKVLAFSTGFLSTFTIDADVHLGLYAAAKDFEPVDLDVEASLYKCGALSGCDVIATDTVTYQQSDRWRQKLFHFVDVDTTFLLGQWLEVRIAVLDTSDDDGWFAFGTDTYDSKLIISDGD